MPPFPWPAAILLIGLYQTLVLLPVLLLRRSGNRVANRLVAGLMLVLAYLLLMGLLRTLRLHGITDPPFAFSPGINFLYGPLFYFTIRAYLERDFRFRRRDLRHLLPTGGIVLLRVIAWVAFDIRSVGPPKLLQPDSTALGVRVMAGLIATGFLAYLGAGIRLVMRYTREVKATRSYTDVFHLRWLVFLTSALLLPLLTGLVTLVVSGPPVTAADWKPWPAFAICASVAAIALAVLIRPEVLNGLPEALMVEEATLETPEEPARRYGSSPLTDAQKARIHAQLLATMATDKPWLNQELTLEDLAARLGVNARYLSQVINEVAGQNFFDFVNGYRIRRAQEMLVSPAFKHYTVQAVAQECGFKSRSAFYTAFKVVTGQTPSAYKGGEGL